MKEFHLKKRVFIVNSVVAFGAIGLLIYLFINIINFRAYLIIMIIAVVYFYFQGLKLQKYYKIITDTRSLYIHRKTLIGKEYHEINWADITSIKYEDIYPWLRILEIGNAYKDIKMPIKKISNNKELISLIIHYTKTNNKLFIDGKAKDLLKKVEW